MTATWQWAVFKVDWDHTPMVDGEPEGPQRISDGQGTVVIENVPYDQAVLLCAAHNTRWATLCDRWYRDMQQLTVRIEQLQRERDQ